MHKYWKLRTLFALLILIGIMVFSIGCQKQTSLDVVVTNFCTHLQKLEFDQTTKYVYGSSPRDNSPFEDELIRSGFANMTFKVGETKFISKDAATVSVAVSAPNIGEALDLAMYSLYASRMYLPPDPESLLKAKTYETIKQNQSPIIQTTTVFTLKKDKRQWYIVNNDEFNIFALRIFGY